MRIAFVLERLGNGGAERVTASLATEFAMFYGYDVHIFTYVKEENEYYLPETVTRHVMSVENNSDIKIFDKVKYLSKELKNIKPDVVYSLATPKTTILLCLLSIIRKFTLIVSERNDPNQYPKEMILKLLRNIAYMVSDGVVFQTPDARNYFNKYIQRKSIVIPNPISEGLCSPYKGERKHSVVNFCRLEKQKNLKLLIDSMIAIHNEFSDYVLEIYGEGTLREELEKYCSKQNAESYIKFMGFESNIHEKINDASLYVSSSNYEGISNSMLEAIALGIPTISTDCPIGGAKMVIENMKNGILVPVENKPKLIEAMRNILNDKELSNTLSENGVKLRIQYSVKNIAKRWDMFAREKVHNEKYN